MFAATAVKTLATIKAALRCGRYTDLGSYPVYYVCNDGACLCHDCVKKEYKQIAWATLYNLRDGWNIAGPDVNYEDGELTCDHCGERIESAYGEEE